MSKEKHYDKYGNYVGWFAMMRVFLSLALLFAVAATSSAEVLEFGGKQLSKEDLKLYEDNSEIYEELIAKPFAKVKNDHRRFFATRRYIQQTLISDPNHNLRIAEPKGFDQRFITADEKSKLAKRFGAQRSKEGVDFTPEFGSKPLSEEDLVLYYLARSIYERGVKSREDHDNFFTTRRYLKSIEGLSDEQAPRLPKGVDTKFCITAQEEIRVLGIKFLEDIGGK